MKDLKYLASGRRPLLWTSLLLAVAMLFVVACSPPEEGCKANTDCTDTAKPVCKAGKCVADSTTGTCNPACATDETCNNGTCEKKSTGACDPACATGESCKDGKCVKDTDPNKCDPACATDETCENGTCKKKTDPNECKPACAAGETCENGTCVKKTDPNKCDPACGSDEVCQGGKCVPKPKGCANCGVDEYCFENLRCLKTPKTCKEAKDCASTETCVRLTEKKSVCLSKCDPSTNTSEQDFTNKACTGGWGWCLGTNRSNPKAGACVPPASKKRKVGETCRKFEDFSKADYHDCVDGSSCNSGKCVASCDTSKGKVNNPGCKAGTYCAGSGKNGTCRDLPDMKEGTKKAGEDCSNVTKDKFCDGKAGLYCKYPKCAKACDPRKGKTGNPACGASDECVEDPVYSHLGGGCLAKATQKEGEVCDNSSKRCLTGLRCSGGKCIRSCTSSKPQPAECKSDEVCYVGTCVKKCDPANGVTGNSACGSTFYCVKSSTYKPGYCRALPEFKKGPVGLGESCSNVTASKFCDGSKKLFCKYPNCVKACDITKGKTGNADCGSGDECVEDTSSPIGGRCLPKATQTTGQECNSNTKRCVSGLNCYSGFCEKACDSTKPQPGGCGGNQFCYTSGKVCVNKCDPANGTVGNSACGSGFYCVKSTSTYKPGYCRRLPTKKVGPKKEGESCSNFSSSSYCDGNAGLVCYSSKCAKGCDPSKGKDNNPACGSNSTCETYTSSSHLGGVCRPKPSQQVDQECDGSNKRCVTGLTCITFGAKAYCQKNCDPTKTGECGADYKCEKLRSGGAVCIKNKKTNRKLHEVCGGAPATPEYDDCDAKYICAGVSGSNSHCLAKCDPKAPKCPTDFVCTPLSGGSGGVCTQTCKDKADCNAYGNQCRQLGSNKICI